MSETPQIDILNKNENTERIYSIENIMQEPLNVRMKYTVLDNQEEWGYSLSYNGNPFDSIDVTIDPQETAVFDINIQTNDRTGSFEIQITAENLDPNSNFRSVINYFSVVTSGDILLVDDDGEMDFEIIYTNFLDGSGNDYTKLNPITVDRIKEEVPLNNFDYVFWNLGIESPSLSAADVTGSRGIFVYCGSGFGI